MGTGLPYRRFRAQPYQGAGLHPKVAVKHFLERRDCTHDQIYWAIKGHRVKGLKDTLDLTEELICETLGEDAVKSAQLSLIGLWGKPPSKEWHVERTWATEDMEGVDMVSFDDAVPPTHKACTVVLSNYSYMPIALHVLYQEAVWMDKMRRVLWHVDNGPFSSAVSPTTSSSTSDRSSAGTATPKESATLSRATASAASSGRSCPWP